MNRIRELRKQKGLTLAELGEKVNLSPSHIGNIENHRRGLDAEWIGKFSEALGVSPTEIMVDWAEASPSPGIVTQEKEIAGQEKEILRIYNMLSFKGQAELLLFGYGLAEKEENTYKEV